MVGPRLFNIFLCDFFFFLEGNNIASYADDTTPYNANLTHELVTNELEETSILLWFHKNFMKENSDEIHLLISGDKAIVNIDKNRIESEDIYELLGITIDWKGKLKTKRSCSNF